MKVMKAKKLFIGIILLIVIIGCIFYWFQWRPSKIRRKCNQSALEMERANTYWNIDGLEINGTRTEKKFQYDTVYPQCLRENGLK